MCNKKYIKIQDSLSLVYAFERDVCKWTVFISAADSMHYVKYMKKIDLDLKKHQHVMK